MTSKNDVIRRLLAAALLLVATSAQASDLIITGVIDGPLSGGVPKAVELYVAADIADLSAYGIESANNGAAAAGPEFTLPAQSATAGTWLHVASETPGFQAFFGFPPDFTSSAVNINGDDAIVLYRDGVAVDVYGEIGVDGTGQAWEHTDSWSYRIDGTGPDGTTFDAANWNIPGPNVLDGETSNATASTPFPIRTFGGGGGGPVDPPPVARPAKIHEVQGTGPTVAITDLVSVQGIVTALFENDDAVVGFFVQEESFDTDGDPATSEGIYVFCDQACPPNLAADDLVTVVGRPGEFFQASQIDARQGGVTIDATGVGGILPTAVSLPAAGSTLDPATFEAVEGMLVSFPDTLFVSEYFNLPRFGELVLTQGGRPQQFTNANAPGQAGLAAYLDDLERRRIVLDDNNSDSNDAIFNGPNPDEPYFYPQGGFSVDNFFRGGDTVTGLTGVMNYAFSTWRIQPTPSFDYTFVRENERTAAPEETDGRVTVASFNVLNYFETLDVDGSPGCGPNALECRGADSAAELDRQTDKIVDALRAIDADVVGLIEIENDADDSAAARLVAALSATGASWASVPTGFIGTDAIKVALIYQPDVVTPVGGFAILDGSVDPRFIDTLNRPVLAQSFEEIETGARFTVAVAHLKSKGSSCESVGDPDTGDGQGNCNGTRTDAALATIDWLATDPTASGDPDVLVIGDMNAYAQEDPITAFRMNGYTDLVNLFEGADAYSFVFDGQLGYLDHALAGSSLASQVSGTTVWHINADEANVLDYNDTIRDGTEAAFERKSDALPLFSVDPWRSSDHDPIIVGLDLAFVAPPAPEPRDCLRGGWRDLTRDDGSSFRNTGQCVSYFKLRSFCETLDDGGPGRFGGLGFLKRLLCSRFDLDD